MATAATSIEAAGSSLQISPPVSVATVGDKISFVASGLSTQQLATCTWATGSLYTLTNLGGGSFFASNPGETIVSASCNGQTVTAKVTINASVPSGPIQITKGGTYSGNWASTDPSVPAVLIRTDEPVILQNSSVAGPGNLIMAYGAAKGALNLQVKNVVGHALIANAAGLGKGMFLYAEGVASLDVTLCTMTNVSSGVIVGNPSRPTHLSITRNLAQNMDDRMTDGLGGMSSTRAGLGHFILLDHTVATNGAEIAWNQVINAPGQSSVEDIINLYAAQGGSSSASIVVHDNYLQGAVSYLGADYSGGGITIDNDGTDTQPSAFIGITNNQIVSTQNGGLAINNGHDITATGNRVVSSGQASNGVWLAGTSNGGFALNMINYYSSKIYFNNSLTGNYASMVRRNTQGQPTRADLLAPGANLPSNNIATGNIEAVPTNDPSVVTLELETQEYISWLNKIKNASITVGAS